MSIGPALGGLLTQHFGWPYIFYVNVPIGLIMIAVASRVLTRRESSSEQPFDPAGAGTMAIALSTLLFALSKGLDLGWCSPLILSMLGVSVVAIISFAVIENRITHPALDFKLFSEKMFTASALAAYLCYLCTAAVNFLLPFYLIHANGFPEAKAGMIMMATPVAMMCLTGFSGFISDKVGVRLPATLGMIFMAIGIWSLRRLAPGTQPQHIVPFTALIGIGAGFFTAPNNSALMGSAPKNRQGVAGAILAAARTTGFASGTAIAGLIYMTRLSAFRHLSQPWAITHAIHTGMGVIACVALMGMCLSAVRGKSRITKGKD
jgi:MFS family permease